MSVQLEISQQALVNDTSLEEPINLEAALELEP